jgi:hypothetical protein
MKSRIAIAVLGAPALSMPVEAQSFRIAHLNFSHY